jgi:hypothetical protein
MFSGAIRWAAIGTALALGIPGCRDAPSRPRRADAGTRQAAGSKKPDPALAELVEQLREYHRLRQYQRIEELVASECRRDLIKLLSVVDRILLANGQVMTVIRKTCPPPESERWDLSMIADSMGIFSSNLKAVDTTVQGDEAIFHYQVGESVPLRRAIFVRRGDQFCYRPDTVPGLAELLDELAVALDSLAATFQAKPPTQQDIESEYRHRILPIIGRMEKLSSSDNSPAKRPPA